MPPPPKFRLDEANDADDPLMTNLPPLVNVAEPSTIGPLCVTNAPLPVTCNVEAFETASSPGGPSGDGIKAKFEFTKTVSPLSITAVSSKAPVGRPPLG